MLPEVLHVFQTRFSLHLEIYQHRVVSAVALMLRDAMLLADQSELRVFGAGGGLKALRAFRRTNWEACH